MSYSVDDIIKTLHLINERDNIYFLPAQRQPGSFAHKLLDACTLAIAANEDNYDEFSRLFLEALEEVLPENVVL